MNEINEDLNDLGNGDADKPPIELIIPESPVTPVVAKKLATPVQKNRRQVVLLVVAAIMLVVLCVSAWLWWRSQHKIAVPTSVVQAPTKLIANPQAASPPVAVVTHDASLAESGQVESGQVSGIPAASPEHLSQVHASSAVSSTADELATPLVAKPQPKHNKALSTDVPAAEVKAPATPRVPKPAPALATAPVEDSMNKQIDVQPPEAVAENPEAAPVAASAPVGKVDKKVKPISVQQQADNEFRRASGLMQQGHISEALPAYEAALKLDPGHDAARQAMVVLLLESKRNADAERVLQDGVKRNPKHSGFAMLLARLQIERGAPWSALLTLQKTLPYADQQADYQAFVAALLQRLDHHQEAVAHYQAALQLSPNSGLWLMGMGMSLQALHRNDEARDAFKRAIESHTLSTELQMFVAQRLKEL